MDYSKKCLAILLVVPWLAISVAYPNGAPCEAVDQLQPGSPHGEPQAAPSPYSIRVFLGSERVRNGIIQSSYRYTVEIYGLCNKWTRIRGFLVKAINATTGSVIGRFVKDEQQYWQASHYACRDRQLGAVTHFLAYDRDQPVAFQWVLEDGPRNVEYKDIKFEATVVQNLKTYWKKISWPESEETLCQCPDQDEFTHSCLGYFRAGYCNLPSVRDDLCPSTCNNCSGNVTLAQEAAIQSQREPVSNNSSTVSSISVIVSSSQVSASEPLNSTLSVFNSTFSGSNCTDATDCSDSSRTRISTPSSTVISTDNSASSSAITDTTNNSTTSSTSSSAITDTPDNGTKSNSSTSTSAITDTTDNSTSSGASSSAITDTTDNSTTISTSSSAITDMPDNGTTSSSSTSTSAITDTTDNSTSSGASSSAITDTTDNSTSTTTSTTTSSASSSTITSTLPSTSTSASTSTSSPSTTTSTSTIPSTTNTTPTTFGSSGSSSPTSAASTSQATSSSSASSSSSSPPVSASSAVTGTELERNESKPTESVELHFIRLDD